MTARQIKMYYKKEQISLIKCTLCGLVKTDNPDIEFHPIMKGGVKLWLCHRCKLAEKFTNTHKNEIVGSMTMVFIPKH